MKKIFTLIVFSIIVAGGLTAQPFLSPSAGFKAGTITTGFIFDAFDISDGRLFGLRADSVVIIDLETNEVQHALGLGDGYSGWGSFLTVKPGGNEFWVGYTVADNSDDRIYRFDMDAFTWHHEATFPGNFDLAWREDTLLISGLNSTSWLDPAGIFILDTTGADNHRKIIETGGSATGLAVDASGSLYSGTYFFSDPNELLKWTSDTIGHILAQPDGTYLKPEHATKLSDLPAGTYDCEVDDAGNVVFNFSTTENILAAWDGETGDGMNYDTLATTGEWLTIIRTEGNIALNDVGNRVLATAYGNAVNEIHRDYRPVLIRPIPNFSNFEDAPDESLDLAGYFSDPDDEGPVMLSLTANTEPRVAAVSLSDTRLTVDYLSGGQTNIIVQATSNGLSASAKFVAGAFPDMTGEGLQADFEEISLGDESYWNGSDESGGFSSGPAWFFNDYNPDWLAWNGWAISNTSDTTSPGYLNQYSAITGADINGDGENYAVSFPFPGSAIKLTGESLQQIEGLYVTNNTYAVLSMMEGDFVAKKFGGESGNDQDWFRLTVEGFRHGNTAGTTEYMLADFRHEDNHRDYIIQTWQWLGLSELGKIDSLSFSLSSSDMGEWGMNTPAFFSIDNLVVLPDAAPEVAEPVPDFTGFVDDEKEVDLTAVFTDPDDNDGDIIKQVASISDASVLSANLDGNLLSMHLTGQGSAVVTVKATSNGKSVSDQFLVNAVIDGLPHHMLKAISIYPNPGSGLLYVDTGTLEPLSLVVFDAAGREVLRAPAHRTGDPLDLSAQPAGTYLLKITYPDRVVRKTIIRY